MLPPTLTKDHPGCTVLDLFQFFPHYNFCEHSKQVSNNQELATWEFGKVKQNIRVLDTRNNSDKTKKFIALFVMLFTWQFHERSLDTVTPRSRRRSHVSRVVLLTLYEGTGLSLRRVIHMTWHLDGFNWRELFFDHQFNESKSDCKIMVPNNFTLRVSISKSQGVETTVPQEDVLKKKKKAQEDEG